MKVAILSRSMNCYSTRRLKEAAVMRGHQAKVLDTLRFSIDLEKGEPDLFFRAKQLSHYDAVIPRIGASITYFGTAVVRQFEQMDVFTTSSSAGIVNSTRQVARTADAQSSPDWHSANRLREGTARHLARHRTRWRRSNCDQAA